MILLTQNAQLQVEFLQESQMSIGKTAYDRTVSVHEIFLCRTDKVAQSFPAGNASGAAPFHDCKHQQHKEM